jgi:hypothetical protein
VLLDESPNQLEAGEMLFVIRRGAPTRPWPGEQTLADVVAHGPDGNVRSLRQVFDRESPLHDSEPHLGQLQCHWQ